MAQIAQVDDRYGGLPPTFYYDLAPFSLCLASGKPLNLRGVITLSLRFPARRLLKRGRHLAERLT